MPMPELITALSQPGAYPGEVERVEVPQTNASVLFFAGDRVYKVKKQVDLRFLDFTTYHPGVVGRHVATGCRASTPQ